MASSLMHSSLGVLALAGPLQGPCRGHCVVFLGKISRVSFIYLFPIYIFIYYNSQRFPITMNVNVKD